MKSAIHEIIVTRATVSIGEDIGYLPGTEEEKMTPWMGALTDNLEVLTQPAGRWRMGPCSNQRPAGQPGQSPGAELHARPHFPEPFRHY